MKINFVYDFFANTGRILNGINPWDTKQFLSVNFDLRNPKRIRELNEKYNREFFHWPNSFLYEYGNTEDLSTYDLDDINKNELYLYPITTQGDLYDFVSDREPKHKTKFFYISETFKDLLKKYDNFFIYIEHSMEPYFDSYILKRIYDVSNENGIPFHKLLITNGSNSNHLTFEDFKEKYDYIKKYPKLVTYNWQVPYKALDMLQGMGLAEGPDNSKSTVCGINHIDLPKVKKALFLTRRLRIHRILLLSLMFDSKLIDKTLYSLDMELNFYPNFKDMVTNEFETMEVKPDKNYIDTIFRGYDLMVKQNKKVADYDLVPYLSGFGNESKELYEQTFFTIVQETEFSIWQQASTEKILQPILHTHPFVVVGSPYSLKNLKRLGFKTFDKWWDESYDDEEDDWKRLIKVYSLIESLLSKSDEELRLMLHEMKEILEYNKNHLKTFDWKLINDCISNKIHEFLDKDKNIIQVM